MTRWRLCRSYGADAIRWYFYINSAPWLPNRFHGRAVMEGQRKFLGTLWNTYAFYVLYAEIDKFDPTKHELEYEKLSVMDKWLLSKLNTLIGTVDHLLDTYQIPETARALADFVDDMSNWYVRRSRERFWAKGMEQDKVNAYMTLYTALVTVCKAGGSDGSVHDRGYLPEPGTRSGSQALRNPFICATTRLQRKSWIDKDLEKNMDELLKIVVMGRACRNASNIKNRQPIGQMFIKAPFELDEYFTAIIRDELNVKNVKYTQDVRDFTSYSFKPQMRTLGPKYGKQLGEIRTALAELDGNAAMDELNETGELKLTISTGQAVLTKDDLLIESAQMEGYVSEQGGEITVVMDTRLTDELLKEGMLREIISKIQTMRKEAGFEVMDNIRISVADNAEIEKLFKAHSEELLPDVLAKEVVFDEKIGYNKEWNINGEKVTLGVEKLA